MLRPTAIAAAALVFSTTCASAGLQPTQTSANPGARISVDVTSAARDMMARRLASAVVKELERDPRLRLVASGSRGNVSISLPAGVGWERRLDWTEISYQARLNATNGRSRPIAGRCWNWNLNVCARQIVDAAVQFAGD